MTERVILHTERLTLRPLRATDFDAFAAYYTGPRTGYVGGPVTRSEAFTKFCAMIGHWQMRGFGRLAICLRGEERAFGHAGLLQLDDAAVPELTWTLWDGAMEGHGYAREAARAVRDHGYATLRLPVLAAVVHRDNAASQRVAEAIGGIPDPSLPTRFPEERVYRVDPQAEVPA